MESSENPKAGLSASSAVIWEQVLRALPDGLIVTDREFNIRYVNPAFTRISGRTADRIIDEKCHRIFPCELCHTDACPLTRLRQAGGHLQYESDGHCKVHQAPWRVTASAYYDVSGKFDGIVEKVTDGSTLLQVRDQLYHSHER